MNEDSWQELGEDLSLKQDQARLVSCKDLFSSLRADESPNLGDKGIEVLAYLHDTWSVIRGECGKQLMELSRNSATPAVVWQALAQSLQSECKSSAPQWQVVHGSVLGLNALVGVLDSSFLDGISNSCLDCIGHARIPIKEASRSCLLSIQKKLTNKNKMVNKIIRLVDIIIHSPTSDAEASTLALDGMLGCLVDSYQQFPQLILSASVMLSGADAEQNSSVEVVSTVKLCALHPASTVRQKAGQILTLFIRTFLKKGARRSESSSALVHSVPLIVTIITTLLMESLKSANNELWRMQEISLMVTEELVCMLIELELEQLPAPSSSDNLILHMYSFLDFLKNHLSTLLSHDQFEVRRMTIQLMPQLARAFVLMNPPVREAQQLRMELSFIKSTRSYSDYYPTSQDALAELPIDVPSRGLPISLDMALGAKMVWLSDVVKENQHLFEAFELEEGWSSSAVTKDLRLRSYSSLEAAYVSAKRWSRSTSVPMENDVSRGVVDNWSNDVRGRILEIEKRAQFHRSVKGLVYAEDAAAISAVTAVLSLNCTSIMGMVEDVLGAWEDIFSKKGVSKWSDDAASGESSLPMGRDLVALPADFIECYSLVSSFLMSVQYRFLESPHLHAARGGLADVIATAGECKARLDALFVHWVGLAASVQSGGRSSTHLSRTAHITGLSSGRQTATALLTVILRDPCGLQAEELDTFKSSLKLAGSDALGRVLALAEVVLRAADEKDSGCRFSLEESWADRVVLVGTLTNPVQPSSVPNASSDTHYDTFSPSSSQTIASPAVAQMKSLTSTGLPSPTHVGTSSKSQSMDRWNCEAVSPLLTCMANAADPVASAYLAALSAEWTVACLINPLWLDNRHNPKKNLFEALVLSLAAVEKAHDPVLVFLLLRVVRAIAEILSLRSPQPLLELKQLMCTVKAALLAVTASTRLYAALTAALTSDTRDADVSETPDPLETPDAPFVWDTLDKQASAQGAHLPGVRALQDLARVETAELGRQSHAMISSSLAYYKEVFPRGPTDQDQGHGHQPPCDMSPASHQVKAGSEDSATDSPGAGMAEGEGEDGGGDGDEFSDWDEESASGDERPEADASAYLLANLLWGDMEALETQLGVWADMLS